ncbi:MAG TPA: MDR family MFS transporter [Candidatus Limnocylindrales bacterium]|nr:MDR family MFS transporter [Candidatus Limnocylindrales bacterium]
MQHRRYWVLGAVMVVQFTSVLTSTIVSTAAPTIVDELHGLDLYAWIFTAYLLASSVTVPVVGKLSDLFGRRPFYIGGLLVFLLGSMVSGLSQNMVELIGARALTGIGGGAMMALSVTTLGDIFSPRERGRWMGLIMSVFGLGSIVGPTVGGFITDHFGWRWVFYVNLPLGIVSLAMLAWLLPRVRPSGRARIDWIGIALLVLAVVPVLVGLTWAGVTYAWTSWQVIGTLGTGAIVAAAFAWYENRAREPVLSLHLFENRTFTVAVALSFLLGIALFGSLTFLPLYAQGVKGQSAQDAGLILAPMMIGFVIGSVIGGQLLTRTGRYRVQAIIGMALAVVGIALMSRLDAQSSWSVAIGDMVITGIGVGAVFPILSVVVQSSFPYRLLGTANSARQFFNNLGAVVGVPVMTTIVLETFRHELPPRLPAAVRRAFAAHGQDIGQGLVSGVGQSGLSQIPGIPPAVARVVIAAVRESLAVGIQRAFLLGAVLAGLGLILTFFLPEIPLRGTVHDEASPTAQAPAPRAG